MASRPKFLALGNHLEPFSKVSDPPEGQKQGGGAVGSQEGLQVVKPNLGSNSVSEHARYMVLVSKPGVLGHTLLKISLVRSWLEPDCTALEG